MKSGLIIINKPSGPTSHDIVDELRRITGERKIGHSGTLDPFASGVLLLAIGREATKEIGKFVGLDKIYQAKIKLGAVSDTYDRTGKIKSKNYEQEIEKAEIEKVLEKFIGETEQIPPMYSAKKIKGKKLYELARKGKEIERPAKKVRIDYIKLLNYKWPDLEVEVKCSSGTYIRSLAYDIGQVLECGAYLEELERLVVGDFKIDQAIDLAEITPENWQDYLILALKK